MTTQIEPYRSPQQPMAAYGTWRWGMITILVAWLSASLLLDVVIMPGLYGAGMMASPGFAMAGNLIFERFNHVELLAAAGVLSGCLLATQGKLGLVQKLRGMVAIALLLLLIPILYTYILTPQMSALGFQNILETTTATPDGMDQLHSAYWSLELLKIGAGTLLLSQLWRPNPAQTATYPVF